MKSVRQPEDGAGLAVSAEHLRALVEGVADYAIFLLDAEGRVASWGRGAERIKGYTAAEIIGKHFSCFYPAAEVAQGKPQQELQQAAATGRLEDEGWRVRKDGSRFWADVVITSLRDDAGRLQGFLKITRDLTERKRVEEALVTSSRRAEAAEAKFRALLVSAPDGIVIVNQEGRIEMVNRRTEQLFGYGPGELLGQNVEILLPAQLRAAHLAHRAAYRAQPQTRPMGSGLELLGRRRDGSEFPVEISLSPLDAGGEFLVMSIIRDVTDQRKLQHSLKRRAAELEAANRELEAFSYSVSHDLRAPLRAIGGFSQILLETPTPGLTEELRGYLRIISDSAQQMGRLIDDLLAFSRLGRQSLKEQRVAPADLVEQCLRELHSEVEGRRVKLLVGELPECQADPAMLKQVFTNLLANALKFTRKRDEAVIEVGATPARNGEGAKRRDGETTPAVVANAPTRRLADSPIRAVYFVRDNGVGFDMRYADKLFGVFQRLHRVEEYEGTGVGLALVQRIVQRHGGQIWAEAEPDKGATFYFTLGNGAAASK